jgi:glycosyltransferase involved in cell wall biosynthesis
MQPTFSIIIPAHNEENYIRQTLHSIKNQSYQNYEVIVVTNGCTDKTEELVKKRLGIKMRMLSLPKPNVSVARNAGALNSQGKILLFLDADTLLENDSLQKIKEEFTEVYSIATAKVLPDENIMKYKMLMGLKNFGTKTNIYKGFGGILICHKNNFHDVKGYDPEIVVKEHWGLRERLEKLGKYKRLNTSVTTSMRRYKKWGLIKAGMFWLQYLVRENGEKARKYEKVR